MANDSLTASISRILNTLPHRKEVVRLRDMVKHTSTHALGDGQWSIELHTGYDDWSPCIAEFVGSNGTRNGEEADDLWAEVSEWENDPKRGGSIHHVVHWYTLPDGREMNFKAIVRDVECGYFHGMTLAF